MGLNRGVMANCHQRCHVEAAPDVVSPAPDDTSAPELAAVAVEWCDSHQRRDLLPRTGAQFGQLGDEGAGGLITDAGDALEELFGLSPQWTSLDALINLRVELTELLFDQLQDR